MNTIKMRSIFFTAFILIGVTAFAEEVKVSVFIKNNWGNKTVTLTVNDKINTIVPRGNGSEGELTLDIDKPVLSRLNYSGQGLDLDLYLIPGKDIEINIDGTKARKDVYIGSIYYVTVNCDDNGINKYLFDFQEEMYRTVLGPFSEEDMYLNEEESVKHFEEMVKAKQSELDEKPFNSMFKKLQHNNIAYTIGKYWVNYAKYATENDVVLTDAYYNKVESLITTKPEIERLVEYKLYMKEALYYFFNRKAKNSTQAFTDAAKYAANIKNEQLRVFLIEHFASYCSYFYGYNGMEEIAKMVEEYVDTRLGRTFIEDAKKAGLSW